MNTRGIIIEESLADRSALAMLKIISTEVETVTEKHKTPWLSQWTLHTVEVPCGSEETIAKRLSQAIDIKHASSWYLDFKNNAYHWIIFSNQVFKVEKNNCKQYQQVTEYGLTLGIPSYQLDWEL